MEENILEGPIPINTGTKEYLHSKERFLEDQSFSAYIDFLKSAVTCGARLDDALNLVNLVPISSPLSLHKTYTELNSIWSIVALIEPAFACSFRSGQLLSNLDNDFLTGSQVFEKESPPFDVELPEKLKETFDDFISSVQSSYKSFSNIFEQLPLYESYSNQLIILKEFTRSHYPSFTGINDSSDLFPPDWTTVPISEQSRTTIFYVLATLACRAYGGIDQLIYVIEESTGTDGKLLKKSDHKLRHAAIITENIISIAALLGVAAQEIGFDKQFLERSHLNALRSDQKSNDGVMFLAASGINLILRLLPFIGDEHDDKFSNYASEWLLSIPVGAPETVEYFELEESIREKLSHEDLIVAVSANLSLSHLPAFQLDQLSTYGDRDDVLFLASRALDCRYKSPRHQFDLLAPPEWIDLSWLPPYNAWMSDEEWENLNPGIISLPIYRGEIHYFSPKYFTHVIESFINRGFIFYANTVATIAFVWFSQFEYRICDIPHERLRKAILELSGSSNFGTTKIAMSWFLNRSPYRVEHLAWLGDVAFLGGNEGKTTFFVHKRSSYIDTEKEFNLDLKVLSEESRRHFSESLVMLKDFSEGRQPENAFPIIKATIGLESELKERFFAEISDSSQESNSSLALGAYLDYLSKARRVYERDPNAISSSIVRIFVAHDDFRDFVNDSHRLRKNRNEHAHAQRDPSSQQEQQSRLKQDLNRLRGILLGGQFLRFLCETAP